MTNHASNLILTSFFIRSLDFKISHGAMGYSKRRHEKVKTTKADKSDYDGQGYDVPRNHVHWIVNKVDQSEFRCHGFLIMSVKKFSLHIAFLCQNCTPVMGSITSKNYQQPTKKIIVEKKKDHWL